MKIYYARPISIFGTEEEKRQKEMITKAGFELHDPNKKELIERYKKEGMKVFLEEVDKCEGLIFSSFVDGKIGAGVKAEIDRALENNKPVFEIPNLIGRTLSVEDTRSYLMKIGYR